VFLDEYSPLGTLVESIALPTTGSAELTAVGNDTTEGIISAAQNGVVFNFTGYRADAGTADPASGTGNRVIGIIGLNGVPNTSTALTDATGTIRSAGSTDGSSLFYVGTSAGLFYYGSPSGASTSTAEIDTRSSRQALIGGNALFASGTLAGNINKVINYGTLPTSATVGTPVIATTLTDTVNGFALFDLNGSVGPDTIYALSTSANKVYKYTYNGTSWSASGSISAGGAMDISGVAIGSTVDLFLTSSTTLYSETDSSGYGGSITGTLTTLATAGANEDFRGITYIPEPSTVGLGVLAAATLTALRRRRS